MTKKHLKHPILTVISIFIRDVDEDPKWQYMIHRIGFWYWTINFPVIAYLFIAKPSWWVKYGLFITLLYSIYSNWSTDLAGMSSAETLRNTTVIDIGENNG